MRLRAFAFGKAAEDAGATAHVFEAPTRIAGDYWCADGLTSAAESIVAQLVEASPMPTGLFVAEDRLLPVIDRALRSRGIQPGGEVEIVSCNNEQPHYAGLASQPARIDIRPEAIGRRGVEQLVWRMRHGTDVPERVRVMVDPVLIEPGSNDNGNHVLVEGRSSVGRGERHIVNSRDTDPKVGWRFGS
jgi:DNA-binding LacI/PurR family transcriptional regulator